MSDDLETVFREIADTVEGESLKEVFLAIAEDMRRRKAQDDSK